MRSELGLLHNRLKTTTLYVTHDQVEAMTMGDRVAVLRKAGEHQTNLPANRHSPGFVRSSRQPVRGRVHRLAFHELRLREDQGQRRRRVSRFR